MSASVMTRIGGDVPVLLQGFARECLVDEGTSPPITPSTLPELVPFQAHRLTAVDLACKDESAAFYSGDHRDRQTVEVKFGDFVDYFSGSYQGKEHWLSSVDGLQFYLCQCPIAVYKADETCAGPVLPEIMQLFRIPTPLSAMDVSQVNLWMAVGPSRTGIHYDAYRNVLVVLYGEKVVKLYPPSQTKYLYPRPIYSRSSNHSAVDFANPDHSAYPNFVHATPTVIVVPAGNALYIPEGWWHQVDSAPFTIAVNLWFNGLRDQLVADPQMGAYYARVIMEDIVRKETARAINERCSELRADAETAKPASAIMIAAQTTTTEDRETMLLSMTVDDIKRTQVELATHFLPVWKEILISASDDFAAFLTDLWDRVEDGADWIPSLFSALGEDGDQIKHDLLVKHERFKKKICSQVLLDTFGN